MKGIYLFLFTMSFTHLSGQQLIFDWAKKYGGSGFDEAYHFALDKSGNILHTGIFFSTADFDPDPAIVSLTAFGAGDIYLAKSDQLGKLLWVKQFGSAFHEAYPYLTLDESDNIYLSGSFEGTVDFDPGPDVFYLSASHSSDLFVCKLDPDGNFLWARQFSIKRYGLSTPLIYDNGFIYLASDFLESVDLDPGPGVHMLNSKGEQDLFILKLNADGNFIWGKHIGGASTEFPLAISCNQAGDIFISGSFEGTVDLDPGQGSTVFTSIGQVDFFLLAISASGDFNWSQQFSSNQTVYPLAMEVNESGQIWIAGKFAGKVDFDPSAQALELSAVGADDIFICKLNNKGNLIWAKQMGGPGFEAAYCIRPGRNGSVYLAGDFTGTVDFDPGECLETKTATGSSDVFYAYLNADGDLKWVKSFGGADGEHIWDLETDHSNNLLSLGYFESMADFDPSAAGVYQLTGSGDRDIFIHKLKPCLAVVFSTLNISSCREYQYNCVTYTVSGQYKDTLESYYGCDSIVSLELVINTDPKYTFLTASSCKNFLWKGGILNSSGIYLDTLASMDGCDSVVELSLTILPETTYSVSKSICEGQHYEGYTHAGNYTDTFLSVNGCDSIRILFLTVNSIPKPSLGKDTSICPGNSIVLNPGSFDAYLWQDGSINQSLEISQPGLYSVTVENSCGYANDEIRIQKGSCAVFFPSAFTPDNNGLNDLFKCLGGDNIRNFYLVVFNRWGQKIFETSDPGKGWDGSFKGKVQDSGLYTWYCRYMNGGNSEKQIIKGTVMLIR